MPKTDKLSEKAELRKRVSVLEQQLRDAEAQHTSALNFAAQNLSGAGDVLFGSAVVVTLTALGGRQIVKPFAITGGLSRATLDALHEDIVRTFDYKTEIRPRTKQPDALRTIENKDK